MSFSQLEKASDDICRGEDVDCEAYHTVRRIDGKCNNLNEANLDWGATATGMRRLVYPPGIKSTAYGDGLHALRKVENILYLI